MAKTPRAPKHRRLNPKVWNSADFRGLTKAPASGQGLWIYLLSSNRMTPIPGLLHAGVYSIAEDTRWSPTEVETCLAEIERAGMAFVDREANLIWLKKAVLEPANWPTSPNHVRSWKRSWDETPDCTLKSLVWNNLVLLCRKLGSSYEEALLESLPKPSASTTPRSSEALPQALPETLPKPYPKPSCNLEQEQEQELELDPPQSPPTGGRARASSPKSKNAEAIAEVYAHWRSYHPRAPARLKAASPDARKIRQRLDDGATVELLKAAIDGCHRTPHNQGQNERGTKYLGLNVIMRDTSQVTRFAEAAEGPPPRASPQVPPGHQIPRPPLKEATEPEWMKLKRERDAERARKEPGHGHR